MTSLRDQVAEKKTGFKGAEFLLQQKYWVIGVERIYYDLHLEVSSVNHFLDNSD